MLSSTSLDVDPDAQSNPDIPQHMNNSAPASNNLTSEPDLNMRSCSRCSAKKSSHEFIKKIAPQSRAPVGDVSNGGNDAANYATECLACREKQKERDRKKIELKAKKTSDAKDQKLASCPRIPWEDAQRMILESYFLPIKS